MRRTHALALVLFASACSHTRTTTETVTPTPTSTPVVTPTPDPMVAPLPPEQSLVRVSMALRGVRPSLADLEAVHADASQLPLIAAGYLSDPRFGDTMVDLHDDAFLVRSEVNPFVFPAVGVLATVPTSQIAHSIHREPLELVRHVVTADRPYTEILTANYTVADSIVADVWGLPYDGTGPDDWRVTSWNDGRPGGAGVLASSTLFQRHNSAGTNYHRGRANFVSKTFLCDDFLSRDVVIDASINIADPDAVAHAVVENPACASCHQTLDPLASFFWGYQGNIVTGGITDYPVTGFYKAQRENNWMTTTSRAPTYFGIPGDNLSDLSQMIADDPRFSLCTAKRFYSWFDHVGIDDVPLSKAAALQQTFASNGYSAKALALAVVLDRDFNAAWVSDGTSRPLVAGMKKATPEQLSRMFADLTGFTWSTQVPLNVKGAQWGTVELPTTDLLGFRVLAGGIDGYFVTSRSETMNTTSSLVLRSFAAEAAGYAVDHDFAIATHSQRTLLRSIDSTDSVEADVRTQLVSLHERLFGDFVAASSPDVDASYAVWKSTLDRTADPVHAWKTTLDAMLQDERIAYY